MADCGANRRAMPLGILFPGLFLGFSETMPYPIVSSASFVLLDKTPDVVDADAESIAICRITSERRIADLAFFLTSAKLAMAGIWYAYIKIS